MWTAKDRSPLPEGRRARRNHSSVWGVGRPGGGPRHAAVTSPVSRRTTARAVGAHLARRDAVLTFASHEVKEGPMRDRNAASTGGAMQSSRLLGFVQVHVGSRTVALPVQS